MQRDLLAWSAVTRRDLPWRRTRDPWAVLVSESMLQQTQVARVVAKYEAFLERFPRLGDCAAAAAGEVVRHWAGLGYNRRALHLHATATACVRHHGGRLPDTLDALMALPGIGAYTARAVLAFAGERDVGVLDTNAARVLARLGGRRLAGREAQGMADELVPAGCGWAWNSAVLDLGAAVCTKRAPRCVACPVAAHCRWATDGRPDPDPANGSAGTGGRQSTFAGSDRQGRGRLVDAMRTAAVDGRDLGASMGWPDDPERAERVALALVAEGLALRHADGSYRLP